MEVVSPGANGHTPSSIPSSTIDPSLIVRHLVDLLEIVLGASAEDLESHGSLLSELKRHDTLQRCTRFASEPQVAVLYVLKDVFVASQPGDTQSIPGTCLELYQGEFKG